MGESKKEDTLLMEPSWFCEHAGFGLWDFLFLPEEGKEGEGALLWIDGWTGTENAWKFFSLVKALATI